MKLIMTLFIMCFFCFGCQKVSRDLAKTKESNDPHDPKYTVELDVNKSPSN